MSNTEENGKSLVVGDTEIEIEVAGRGLEEYNELEVSDFHDRTSTAQFPDHMDVFAVVVSCKHFDCDPPLLVPEHERGCPAGDRREVLDEDTSFLRLLDTSSQL